MKASTLCLALVLALALASAPSALAKKSKDPKDCEVCVKVLENIKKTFEKGDKKEEKTATPQKAATSGWIEPLAGSLLRPMSRPPHPPESMRGWARRDGDVPSWMRVCTS